jgi:hypothetical protein
LWVTQFLSDKKLTYVPPELALDIAANLNSQPKRTKLRKQRFFPVVGLMEYCQDIVKIEKLGNFNEVESCDDGYTSKIVYLKKV